jgi:hypothetical protein
VAASDSTQPADAGKGRSRRALEREKRRVEGKGRPTGLVDAVTGRPVLAHAANGHFYVAKPGWAHFRGRVLDAVVVTAVAGVLMALLNALVQNLALGELSYALFMSEGLFATALIALWFLVVFLYGMAWGTWGSVGDAAVGMRSVRISDGRAAGAWLGGWRAVCWSFVPLYVLMIVVAAFDGTSAGGDFDSRFVAADQHSGLAAGLPPVPAPLVPA